MWSSVKRGAWVWGPAVAQMIAIFVASSIPDLTELPGGISDKTGHFVGYALLGLLVARALAGARLRAVTPGATLLAIALSSCYGATDEFHQRFVHGRSPDVHDWIADTLGALAGALLVALAGWVARRRAV
jgi:VanZ family protein